MRFLDNNKVVGRLEIIKIDSRTGEEEVIFDDHNVITGGLGRSITQLMTRSDCAIDPCVLQAVVDYGSDGYPPGPDILVEVNEG